MSHPLLIVDGYNVLHAGSLYPGLADRDLETARMRLVADVAAMAQGEYEVVVVFDGAANPLSDGASHEVLGVTVIFSATGVDADSVIEQVARDARRAGREVTVATSDATMQWTVLGQGVVRMSAAGLASLLREDAGEIEAHSSSGETRSTVSDRINDDVRRRLDEWARG